MKEFCLPLRLERAPGGAIQSPVAEFHRLHRVVAKNRLHVHARAPAQCSYLPRYAKAPWQHA
jgi:hypothetical protein